MSEEIIVNLKNGIWVDQNDKQPYITFENIKYVYEQIRNYLIQPLEDRIKTLELRIIELETEAKKDK